MPAQPTPPPQRAEPLTLAVRGLKVVIPTAVIISVTILLTPGLAYLVVPTAGRESVPGASQVPLQSWTTASLWGGASAVAMGGIPAKPGPNQKRAGTCDPGRSEVEIRGGCWVQTSHPRPCPEGKQWEYEGHCWLPVAEAKPVPTTGEVRVPGVANP